MTTPPENWKRTPYGKELGANIRAERGRAGLSQKSLAARMQALGFSHWLHQTVGASERGERRVTAIEVLALCMCMPTTMPALLAPPEGDRLVELSDSVAIGSITARRLAVGVMSEFTRTVDWDSQDRIIAVNIYVTPPPQGAGAGIPWYTQFWAGDGQLYAARAVAGDPKKGSDE